MIRQLVKEGNTIGWKKNATVDDYVLTYEKPDIFEWRQSPKERKERVVLTKDGELVGWRNTIPALPPRYVQTTTSDFNASGNYMGTKEYIILPADKPSGYRLLNSNVKGVATNGNYLTNAAYMFYNHAGLYLELDHLDTSNVTNMSAMFARAQPTSLDLSNFNTSNVTSMNYMFEITQAISLDLSSFDTSKVTNMGSMFDGSQAAELDLSSFNTSNVTSMGSMFSGSQAAELDLSSFNTSNVTSMSYMFGGANTTIGYARAQSDVVKFNTSYGKPNTLSFVVKGDIPGEIPSRYVQTTTSNFDSSGNYTGNAEYIILPRAKSSGYRITNSNVKGVATNGNHLKNASYMFNGHSGLYLEVDHLDTSNVTNMHLMFANTQATTLNLSSFNTSNVTSMYGMFEFAQVISLDLSSFNTNKVTNMGAMFAASGVTTLNLSSFRTSNLKDMYYMFYNVRVYTLDLSSFDITNVTNMNGVFEGSTARNVYARTISDAYRFDYSTNKPSTLTVSVK